MSESIVPQRGIVSFLDILGYANFLKNNEPEDAAKTVLDVLATVPKTAVETLLDLLPDEPMRKYISDRLNQLRWLVFSDSILLTCPYPDEADAEEKRSRWMVSIISLIIVYRHLLDNGLPVRGAISFGKFFIKDYCFAGRSIIAAHQIALNLDLAAIAFDDEAVKELKDVDPAAHFTEFKRILVPYLVPLKGGLSQKMFVLPPSLERIKFQNPDIRQIVAESFWKHNKDIPPNVLDKLDNTENLLRFMKTKFPRMFAEKKSAPNKSVDGDHQ